MTLLRGSTQRAASVSLTDWLPDRRVSRSITDQPVSQSLTDRQASRTLSSRHASLPGVSISLPSTGDTGRWSVVGAATDAAPAMAADTDDDNGPGSPPLSPLSPAGDVGDVSDVEVEDVDDVEDVDEVDVIDAEDVEEKTLCRCRAGDTFGDLGLLYPEGQGLATLPLLTSI